MRFSTPNDVLSFMLQLESELVRIRALLFIEFDYCADLECVSRIHNALEYAGKQLGKYEEARTQGEAAACSALALDVQENLHLIAADVYEAHWIRSIEEGRWEYRYNKAVAACEDTDFLMTI